MLRIVYNQSTFFNCAWMTPLLPLQVAFFANSLTYSECNGLCCLIAFMLHQVSRNNESL
jgi:hypothetical protein